MQFQQLRAFQEVAAELSFTRAARNLHYAQSTVTTQIKNLEEAVGADLFDRSRRQLTLTEAGLRLLPHARRIIEITETARREVALTRARPPLARTVPGPARRALR
jgi:DNA-binding transcriptional LysR family regulator